MKKLLFVLALALGVAACGGDEPAAPLTEVAYSAQGNAICDQMNAQLDGLALQVSQGVSPQAEREIFDQANDVSRQAIDALFELSPPTSLVEERAGLLELVEERRQLIERLNNGEDLFDELVVVNEQFDTEAQSIWPSCTN